MPTIADIQTRQISLMRLTLETLGNVLRHVSPEQATMLRDQNDAPNGWTVTEVVCHLRDFDGFFYDRAIMMLEQEHPQLPAYDHVALAVERRYNDQNVHAAYAALQDSRARFIELFRQLSDDQWERSGVHPERGHFTLTDAALQVVSHDITHLEQITRILAPVSA